jgi:hypothetical protein
MDMVQNITMYILIYGLAMEQISHAVVARSVKFARGLMPQS